MFDQNQNPNQPNPNNRPFGQAQSPFVPPQPQPQAQPQPQPVQSVSNAQPTSQAVPEDMFASVDGGAVGANRPASYPAGYPAAAFNQPSAVQPAYQPANPAYDQELFGGRNFPWGKVITLVIIILVLAGIGGAVYYGYVYFKSLNKTAGVAPTQETSATTAVPTDTVPATVAPIATATVPVATVEPENIKDSDGDGLTDDEETTYGTDKNIVDSDADGLTDWAEIKIYKTNPLNPDTDNDGYKDGQEVINGYDPLLPGNARLYEVPATNATNP